MKAVVAFVAVVTSLAIAPTAAAEDERSTEPADAATAGNDIEASIAAGPALQRLIDVPVAGVEAIATLSSNAIGMEATFLAGRSQYGLAYERGTLGCVLGGRVGALGFGISSYLALLSIARSTPAGLALGGVNMGIAPHVSWDFLRWDRSALFALARVSGEAGSLTILGAELAIGYRFGP
jgi:hypothetical protein